MFRKYASILGCCRGPVDGLSSVVDEIDDGPGRVSDLDKCFSSAEVRLILLLLQQRTSSINDLFSTN